ncbi:MAG: hypothetical protein WBN85_04015 [Candidatus Macondimonas sp.]
MKEKKWGYWGPVAVFLGLLFCGSGGVAASCQDARGLMPDPALLSDYAGFYVGGDACFYDPTGIRLGEVPPALGPSGDTGQRLIFVNGANPKVEREPMLLRLLAEARDLPAIGILNTQTSDDPVSAPRIRGTSTVKTLESIMRDGLEHDREVLIRAGSAGASVVAIAIGRTKASWAARHPRPYKLDKTLRAIKVETFGGVNSFYPDGPSYVHYANLLDPNAQKFGVLNPLNKPGRGAVIAVFRDTLPPLEAPYEALTEKNYRILSHHGFGVYNANQTDFDRAYRFSPSHLYTIVPLAILAR